MFLTGKSSRIWHKRPLNSFWWQVFLVVTALILRVSSTTGVLNPPVRSPVPVHSTLATGLCWHWALDWRQEDWGRSAPARPSFQLRGEPGYARLALQLGRNWASAAWLLSCACAVCPGYRVNCACTSCPGCGKFLIELRTTALTRPWLKIDKLLRRDLSPIPASPLC